MNAADISALANELFLAESSRMQVEQFSKRFPAMTMDDAYVVQAAWVARKIAAGHKPVGHKIGLTSRAMQIAAQITEPDSGTLLDHMMMRSGEHFSMARFIVPMVEVELAFVLRRDIDGENTSLEDVLDATQYITPALEIIDARIERRDRITKAPRKVVDTISDNAANAAVIVGDAKIVNAKLSEVDLPWIGAAMTKNGAVEETGLASGVLGHPAMGIVWLARRLAKYGQRLREGDFVLSGSFTRPVPMAVGDVFTVAYSHDLGTITFKCAAS
jgi:2-oxo-hept-3-ene-1,7-dioate hydratase